MCNLQACQVVSSPEWPSTLIRTRTTRKVISTRGDGKYVVTVIIGSLRRAPRHWLEGNTIGQRSHQYCEGEVYWCLFTAGDFIMGTVVYVPRHHGNPKNKRKRSKRRK